VHVASDMAHAHNVLIRGLNAILQQAPHVPCSTDRGYKAEDVKDLLYYVNSWAKMVHHHHWVEESFIFPEMEKFFNRPGLMSEPQHQHELFFKGIERLEAYSAATKPEEHRWDGADGMKQILDSFSKPLTDHLYAEIDIFLGLKELDSDGLKKTWDKAEAIAKQTGNIGMLVRAKHARAPQDLT
jgi:hemerythrin-like domain-containing protein